jgi:hypothetical protein
MKRVLQILPILATLTTASAYSSKAQVSVNVNIGAPPMWGPAGYASVDYYYLPDIECYYYVPRQQFVYLSGPNWVFSASLPARCRNYDLYSGYKVVCEGPRPYTHFREHRVAYARYRDYRGHQRVWRDCPDEYRRYCGDDRRGRGYYRDYGHDDHDHGRGHGRGRGRGHDRW